MPSSVADVCNRSLSEIGARSVISSIDEASKEAVTCKIWYDNTRKMLLRSAHWGFARRQQALSELGNLVAGTSPYPWQYMYTYPADCIRLRYLLYPPPEPTTPSVGESLAFSPNWMPSRANRFIIANDPTYGRVVLSNVPNAIAVYTADITDPSDWDEGFDDAMSAALSSRLVIPLSGNIQMKTAFEQLATSAVLSARAMDGNEALPSTDHTPDWIAGRGYVADAGYPSIGMWYQSWDILAWGA